MLLFIMAIIICGFYFENTRKLTLQLLNLFLQITLKVIDNIYKKVKKIIYRDDTICNLMDAKE